MLQLSLFADQRLVSVADDSHSASAWSMSAAHDRNNGWLLAVAEGQGESAQVYRHCRKGDNASGGSSRDIKPLVECACFRLS
jgi:hypothetical protein